MIKIAKLSFVVAAVLSLGFPQLASAQESYRLVCRGPLSNLVADGPNANSWYYVSANFAPGNAGASASPPAPGTCTWADRGFRPGEPTRFAFSTRNERDAGHLRRRSMDSDFQWYILVRNVGSALEVTAVN